MRAKRYSSISGIRSPLLKLGFLKNSKSSISNVLDYTISIAVAIMLIVSTIFIASGIKNNATGSIELESHDITNTIVTASPIGDEIDITASVESPIWYKHWELSSIGIDKGPFSDPDEIMKIEKDTFKVILTFPDEICTGPDSTYIWYEDKDVPPPHLITCSGEEPGEPAECIGYTPNCDGQYKGMAEFHIEDVFGTLPMHMADGSTQTITIEGYFLNKNKFSTSCEITIKYGDYYVKKDGSKDYTSIQAAIDDPVTTGKTVYVYEDTYNEQITINKSMNLVGSYDGTYINGTGGGINDYVVRVTEDADGAVISSFIIEDGKTGNIEDETDGLELDGCSNITVTDCEITNNNGRGVVIYNGAQENIIRECFSHENKGHLDAGDSKVKDGDGLVITDDTYKDTEYNYVLGSVFYNGDNFDSDGIVIKNGADYNKIENCHIKNVGGKDWSKGIDIVNKQIGGRGPSNNVIKDCDISDVSGEYIAGIGIWNIPENFGVKNPTKNKIIGGNIHDIKGVGIALYCADNNTIKDVTLRDNYAGIWTLESRLNTVENCVIYNNTDHSVINPYLPASKSNGDGIYFDLESDINTVRYCDIYNNEGVGIYIADIFELLYPSSDNLIEYCNIHDNEGGFLKPGAVVLSCAENTVVRYCNIYNNSCNGLVLSLLSKFNQIKYNNFYCNEEYGVKIITGASASDNNINDNNFAYNNGKGEDAYDGTVGEDNWAGNYWEDWDQNPGYPYNYQIPGLGKDEDPAPQENLIPVKNIIIEDTSCGLYPTIKEGVENAEAGGIVKVYGTYIINESVDIDKELKLIGVGAAIGYNNLTGASIKIQAAGVEIDSFDIQGSSGADGMVVTEGDSVVINNCEIYGFNNGIYITENDVKITNCDIYNNVNGIYVEEGDNNQITSCAFYNNNDGVHFNSANTNTIECCEVIGNIEKGFLVEGVSQNNNIKKCWIKDGNGCGISINNANNNHVSHNHFEGNSQNAEDDSLNYWDDGCKGNYWDDYTGLDTDFDGRGDTAYPIPGGDNNDRYPYASLIFVNCPPNEPSDPSPSDGAIDVDRETTLSWTCSDRDGDPLTYDIYFGDESSPPKLISNQSSTTYAPESLEPITTYYWKVVAWDEYGATTSGAVWGFTTKANTPPNAPSNPDPADAETNVLLNHVLSWACSDPDGDLLSYDVYFEANDPTPDNLVSEGQTETTYNPGTMSLETTYYWRIVAEDEYGATTSGPVWSFTTRDNDPPNTPSAPSPANGATNVKVNSDLSWTCSDPDGDPLTYDVYFGNTSNLVKVSSNKSGANYNPILEYNTTYYWKIVAWDGFGASNSGEVWSFTTGNPPNKPPKANIIKPKNGIYIKDQKRLPLPRLLCSAFIIGDITIEVEATDEEHDIEKVEFYINNKLVDTVYEPNGEGVYTYKWSRDRLRLIHVFIVRVRVWDGAINSDDDCIIVRKFL